MKLVLPPDPSATPVLPTCASKPWTVDDTVDAVNDERVGDLELVGPRARRLVGGRVLHRERRAQRVESARLAAGESSFGAVKVADTGVGVVGVVGLLPPHATLSAARTAAQAAGTRIRFFTC